AHHGDAGVARAPDERLIRDDPARGVDRRRDELEAVADDHRRDWHAGDDDRRDARGTGDLVVAAGHERKGARGDTEAHESATGERKQQRMSCDAHRTSSIQGRNVNFAVPYWSVP